MVGVEPLSRYAHVMRALLFAVGCLACLAAPARADQFDLELDRLFAELNAGDGDVAALEREIEMRWLSPPEPGVAILVERVVEAIDQGNANVARILVDHVTGLAPHYAEGWVIKGRVHVVENDPAAAVMALRRAVTLEPRHYVALELLGDIALNAGDKARAHMRYREALDWNPQNRVLRDQADRLRRELGSQEI